MPQFEGNYCTPLATSRAVTGFKFQLELHLAQLDIRVPFVYSGLCMTCHGAWH